MDSPRQFRFNARNELDPTKEFYYYAVCHVCKNASVNLRRCHHCNTLYYCGQVHQNQDWIAHRPLCRVMVSAANNIQPTINPTYDEFEQYKKNLSLAWEVGLDRQLENFEKHMWMFQKLCAVCYTHEVSIVCENCWSVAYCGEDHRQEHREIHEQFCTTLKFCLVAYQQDARRDRTNMWTGVKFKFSPETMALPDTLEEWVNMIAVSNNRNVSNNPLEMAFGTDHFCYIATILYALEISGILRNTQRQRLVIHVMSTELNEPTGWRQVLKVFFRWFYKLRKLDVYIVNQYVQSYEEIRHKFSRWPPWRRNLFKGRVTFISGKYTAYVDNIPHPDLILLFSTPLPDVENTIAKLAEMQRVPIVITGNSEQYVTSESAKFFLTQFRVYLTTTENRYRTTRPRRNFSVRGPPIVYRHNFIAIVLKRATLFQ